MFNNVRRCLIASVRIHGKFSVRPIHNDTPSPVFHSRAYAGCSNDAVHKRFYCHFTTDEQNVTSRDLRIRQQELDRQKLNELLSVPENQKRFEILQLEVDMLRHNAERVPNNIEENDWLILLTAMSKSKRRSVFNVFY